MVIASRGVSRNLQLFGEMSGISVEIREMSKNLARENFPERSEKLYYQSLYVSCFMLFTAEFCVLVFFSLSHICVMF